MGGEKRGREGEREGGWRQKERRWKVTGGDRRQSLPRDRIVMCSKHVVSGNGMRAGSSGQTGVVDLNTPYMAIQSAHAKLHK